MTMTITGSRTGRRRHFLSRIGIMLSVTASFAGLSAGAISADAVPDGRSPAPAITETDVTSAKIGLMLWTLGNIGIEETTPLVCPILRQDQVGFYAGNVGLAPSSTGYLVDIYFDDQLGDGTAGVSCGPDLDLALDNPEPATPHYLVLEALSLDGGTGTFADVLGNYGEIAFVTAPAAGDLGGEIASGCVSSDMAICLEIWHRDGLVIVMGLVGPAADITESLSQQLITAMLPEAVLNLGNAGDLIGTSTTAVTVAPVPTPPVTTVPQSIPATVPLVLPTVPPVPTNLPTVPTLPVLTTAPLATTPVPTAPLPTLPVLPTAPLPTLPVPTAPLPTAPLPTAPLPTAPLPTAPLPTGPVSIPPGYVQLVDDTGLLTVATPDTWTNIDTVPDVNDDGSPRPYIEASTNIERFRETFDAPGVLLSADPFVADTAAHVDQFGITGGCLNEVIEPFDNGVLVGHIGHWTACGSGAAEFHMVAASPADQSRTIVMQVQITGPQEQQALDLALATFGVVTV